jgi:hypothetical protein
MWVNGVLHKSGENLNKVDYKIQGEEQVVFPETSHSNNSGFKTTVKTDYISPITDILLIEDMTNQWLIDNGKKAYQLVQI